MTVSRVKGHRLTRQERLEVRRRIAAGESFEQAAAAVRCTTKTVQRLLNSVGGIAPRAKERSKLRLSLAEREEISLGLQAGDSLRAIACRLDRAPSTISREVHTNGGRARYRAVLDYGLTIIGAFAIVAVLGGPEERRTRINDFRGLFAQHPLLAGILTLFMLSLAGVPITSGFVAKLVVFGAAVEAGYSWVVVVGAVASAIAAFFYLRILVVMYMVDAEEGDEATASMGPLSTGVIGLTAAATLVLGLFWSPLIELAEKATFFAGP